MSDKKQLIHAALKNGLLWTTVLLILTHFKNGQINWVYMPLWFLFFAGTGAARKYYFLSKEK